MSDIRFGRNTHSRLDRLRLTPEEKRHALAELRADPTITPPKPIAILPMSAYDGLTAPYFGKPGQYTTGFPALDDLTLGFNPGDYMVLGAGTNQGKTQLATYIAAHQARLSIPTLYISRELSSPEMANRFKHITDDDLPTLMLPESHRLNMDQLAQTLTHFKETFVEDKGFVVIDHLHAFCRGRDLTEMLGELSAHLRELAQDLKLPILALSQLNRQVYTDDTGPANFHLKESGYIEDDAYTILLGWRVGAKLNIKLTKARNLDLGSIKDPVVSLTAHDGRLFNPTGLQGGA